jgi:hypothetical protein
MAQGYPEYAEAIRDSWQRIAPSYTHAGFQPRAWQLFEMGCTVEQFEEALTEALADKSVPRRRCLDVAHEIIRERLGNR